MSTVTLTKTSDGVQSDFSLHHFAMQVDPITDQVSVGYFGGALWKVRERFTEVIAKLHAALNPPTIKPARRRPEDVTVGEICRELKRLSTPKHPASIHLYADWEGGIFVKGDSTPFLSHERTGENLLDVLHSIKTPKPEPPSALQVSHDALYARLRHWFDFWNRPDQGMSMPETEAELSTAEALAKEKATR